MIEAILTVLFEVLVEVLFAILAEVVVFALDALVSVIGRRLVVHALFGVAMGALLGAASTWVAPAHMIRSSGARLANLALTPLAVGGLSAALASARKRRRKVVEATVDDTPGGRAFLLAASTTLAFALTRYFMARG